MTEKELSQAYHLAKEKQKEVWLAMPVIFRHAIWDRFEHKIQIIRENAYGQKDIPLIEDIWDGYLIRNMESFAMHTGKPKGVCLSGSKRMAQADHF